MFPDMVPTAVTALVGLGGLTIGLSLGLYTKLLEKLERHSPPETEQLSARTHPAQAAIADIGELIVECNTAIHYERLLDPEMVRNTLWQLRTRFETLPMVGEGDQPA